ncbi:MAG: hypothetical protein BGN82_07060 [Alphaproteobacteria bacterium 65-7]|nr:MAG: hypothetical protein BGN82_07060 [Alphaproteobacteria bacterium 65-7]
MPVAITSVLAAGLAGWVFGAVWYTVLGKVWLRARGLDPQACKDKKMPLAPLAIALVAALVMATVMHQLLLGMGMLGVMTVAEGALAGLTVGIGFMATSVLVNHMFHGQGWLVILIDAAHWIMVAAIQGALIAALA